MQIRVCRQNAKVYLISLVYFMLHMSLEARQVEDNIRLGDLDLNLKGSLGQIYDSNIGSSQGDVSSDWITQVGLQLGGSMELTEINEIRLSIGLEYRKYWENPEYDSSRNFLVLTPETGLELFFQAGNFDFRLYDDFSLLSDPGDQRFFDPNSGTQLNNIVLYDRIHNRLGLEAIWTIHPFWSVNAGLSRRDIRPLDSQFRNLERHSYIASLGLTHSLAANLDIYGQLTGSIDRWRTDFQPDSSSRTTGLGASWKMTDFLTSKVFLAWTQRSFDGIAANQDPTRQANGLTGNIELTHSVNPNLQHSLLYSRSVDLGSVSNELVVQRAEYRIDFSGFERSDLFLGISWDEGAESGIITPERYDSWVFSTGLGYPLSPKLAFSSSFQHYLRESNVAGRNFSRNRVSVKLTYSF